MRNNIITIMGILLWSILFINVFAEDTNSIFCCEESDSNYHYKMLSIKSRKEYDTRLQDAAVTAGECRPSKLDPAGHWGDVVMGFQASIRSKTNVFTVGNPIPVETIFRNTTTNTLSIPQVSRGMESRFIVEDRAGTIVQYDSRKYNLGGSAFGFRPFAPMHQIKYEYDLNRQFSLKAGTYKIHTEQRVFEISSDNKIINFTNLSSGILVIKIIPN